MVVCRRLSEMSDVSRPEVFASIEDGEIGKHCLVTLAIRHSC